MRNLQKQDTVDSKKWEYGRRVMYADVPSFFVLGVGGRSCSNFLAATVPLEGGTFWMRRTAPNEGSGMMHLLHGGRLPA